MLYDHIIDPIMLNRLKKLEKCAVFSSMPIFAREGAAS